MSCTSDWKSSIRLEWTNSEIKFKKKVKGGKDRREGRRERREGREEGERERGREGKREVGREGRKEGGKQGKREGSKERGREGRIIYFIFIIVGRKGGKEPRKKG